jgi:hypothetical protein
MSQSYFEHYPEEYWDMCDSCGSWDEINMCCWGPEDCPYVENGAPSEGDEGLELYEEAL